MKIDERHAKRLEAAIERDENGNGLRVFYDMDFMALSIRRLSLWERGLLVEVLLKAGAAKKPTREQRVLLALFTSHGEGAFHD